MHAVYDQLLTEVRAACEAHYGSRLVALAVFGSVGRGTPQPDSDVDLLLIAEGLPNGRLARMAEFQAIDRAYSDVVREAQELVERALKALLRHVGIEPPKWHDVSTILVEYRERFPGVAGADLERLATASTWLRKERELSFYGDIDFIPTEQYGRDEAARAIEDARFVFGVAERVIGAPPRG